MNEENKSNLQSILTFNLDTEEGRDAHYRACKADQAYRALSEILELLRTYEEYKTNDSPNLFLYNLKLEITNLIAENDIDLYEEYK